MWRASNFRARTRGQFSDSREKKALHQTHFTHFVHDSSLSKNRYFTNLQPTVQF
jgi:hypothetical protein